ncbi:MAG TPA: c-type cytochrome [Burkholderiales bacterium]|nr:c-type cytochrome [Burkholderiales bacterium]
MKRFLWPLALLGVAFALSARAEEPMALARKYACLSCHAVDHKLVGPAWKDVAAKYRGEKDAEAKLIAKVRHGGSGVWGTIPMPPNPTPSDAELKQLVDFILSLK